MMREVPPHCVFSTQHNPRGKWGWGLCASMGQKVLAKLLGHGLITLCCPSIPSRTIVQQQNVSVMNAGFKTLQTILQLLAISELYHLGTTVVLVWRVPAFPLPKNTNLDACYSRPQCTVFLLPSFVGYLVPCCFYQDNFHQLAVYAVQQQCCVHMLILLGKSISAKTTNCFRGLWEERAVVKLIVVSTDRQSVLVANVPLNILSFPCLGLPVLNIPNEAQYATWNESARLSPLRDCDCKACGQTWGSLQFGTESTISPRPDQKSCAMVYA